MAKFAPLDSLKRWVNTDKNQPLNEEERGFMGMGLSYNGISSYANNQAMKISTFYACTNLISNALASMPINVTKLDGNGRKVNMAGSNLWTLLNLQPDPRYSRFQLIKSLVESCIIQGNGYAIIKRDDQLNVTGLYFVNAQYVNPVVQTDGTTKYIIAGQPRAYDEGEILNLNMHLDINHRGTSLIQYACNSLEGAYNTNKYSNRFFKGGAGVSGIIQAQNKLDKEQRSQIRNVWQEAFQSENSIGVAIIPNGLNFQPLSMSAQDAKLIETRVTNSAEICNFFNVPPALVGLNTQSTSYNGLEMEHLLYIENALIPFISALENEMNNKLVKPSQRGKLLFNFDTAKITLTTKESEAKYYKEMLVNGILSINEVRDKLGYSPVDDEAADAHYMQLSYSTIDLINSGQLTKNQTQSQQVDVDNKVKKEKEG